VRETGRTFEANAIKKARAIAKATGRLALADDSGIEVDALGGAPGVSSAHFAGRHGDDAANNAKLLRVLRAVPTVKRTARYRCVLALASPTETIAIAEGVWEGRIARVPEGKGGFGYDPIFWVPARRCMAAQLAAAEKNRLSHRAQAARRMRLVLQFIATG
jgi:XTP/dITP diphosphohydrolase